MKSLFRFVVAVLILVTGIGGPLAAQSGVRNAYGLPYDPNAVIDTSKDDTYLFGDYDKAYKVFIDGDVIRFNYNNYYKTQDGIYDYKNQCWLEYSKTIQYNYIDLNQLYKSIDLSKTNLNRDTSGNTVCRVWDEYFQFPQIAPGTGRTNNTTTLRVVNEKYSDKNGFVYVEGGTFKMGVPNDPDKIDSAHTVTVSSFCICDHEVTQAEYKKIMGTNPSVNVGDNRPVDSVTWYDAIIYCNKRSKAEGLTPCYKYDGTTDTSRWGNFSGNSIKTVVCDWNANGYRLPTEAEWEFAIRGGNYSGGYKYSGSDSAELVAWCSQTCARESQNVKLLLENELGLYDMSGNVSEWCWDWYGKFEGTSQKDPKGPDNGEYRTIRGGSFVGHEYFSTVYWRSTRPSDAAENDVGFRVARNKFNVQVEEDKYTKVTVDEGFVFVEGGSFGMGSGTESKQFGPVHAVTVDSFFMSDHEVTLAEYAKFVGKSVVLKEIGNQPVVDVNWYDALEYCNKRSIAEGFTPCYSLKGETDINKWGENWNGSYYTWNDVVCDFSADGYRLPTEAEWEYAARGGKNTIKYSSLSDFSGTTIYEKDEVAWYKQNSDGYAHDVKTKMPNELEIYDMSGNVAEWCWDWYRDFYDEQYQVNPTGPQGGTYRVLRGGNYGTTITVNGVYNLGVAYKGYLQPTKSDEYTGFRVVRSFERSSDDSANNGTNAGSNEQASARLVYVRGGTFNMGNSKSNSDYQKPVHSVTLDSFYICDHEVTQAEFKKIMGYNPSEFVSENHPVEKVNWTTTVEYCNRRSIAEGLTPCYSVGGETNPDKWDKSSIINAVCDWNADGYRLPTEAEWEFAARGGVRSNGFKHIGSEGIDAVSWYRDNSGKQTHDVMTKLPNELGIYDMGGNIEEWVWDGFTWYTEDSARNPRNGENNGRRIIRGGNWSDSDDYYNPVVTAAYRKDNYFTASTNKLGFRVARSGFSNGKRTVSDFDLAVNDNENAKESLDIVKDDDGNVLVTGGLFSMGTNQESITVDDGYSLSIIKFIDEQPLHSAMVSSFYISDHEVTQSEYKNIMGKTAGSYTGADKPVVNVSWLDAVEYCNALSKKKGLTPCYTIKGNNVTCDWNANGYRLPTEAEWEFAAQGGKHTKGFEFSGSDYIERVAWYADNSGYAAHDVRTNEPNELGIYDMTGNVGEWVWDLFGDYSEETVYNYKGATSGSYHVVRGGSFEAAEYECSVIYRDSYNLTDRSNSNIGFRVARNATVDPGLVYVKGGTFSMGGNFGQYETPGAIRVDAEKPIHTVTVTSFYICDHEVTQLEYAGIMGKNPSNYPANRENDRSNCPVENINWYDAVEYCNRRSLAEGLKPCYSLNGETNPDKWGDKNLTWNSNGCSWDNIVCDWNSTGYRLPTDAEWEYAARGGEKSKDYLYSGSNTLSEVAWIRTNSNNWANEVKTKLPNELGLYDMSGNVKELVWDWFAEYTGENEVDPTGPASNAGYGRVVRNYSFDYDLPAAFRVFVRDNANTVWADRTMGFRVARSSGEPRQTAKVTKTTQTTGSTAGASGFVLVQGGTFKMGSTTGEKDEKPVHSVTLSNFYMCDHEVTQAEYKAVTGKSPSYFSGNNKPVEQVSWYDAIEYCNALSRKEGLTPCYTSKDGVYTCDWNANGYRLPTEAEWEYAARGGNKSKDYKYSGANAAGNVAWSKDNAGNGTHDVKSKNANELGLYDMSGNVAEWCWDWYGTYGSASETNPKGASSGSYRARRGGSWSDAASATSVTYRDGNSPNRTANNRGFRVVRNAQ